MEDMVCLKVVDIFAGYHVYSGVPLRIQLEHLPETLFLPVGKIGEIFENDMFHIFIT